MLNTEAKQSIFIITGMHRSGTSLTASLLQSAGVDIGQRLVGTHHGNVKGHFEDIDFLEFHESVLYSQGINTVGLTLEKEIQVQEQYLDRAKLIIQNKISKPIWGWKEPRTTLFLNFWAEMLSNAKFLFIYRSPWEVVDSLYRRGSDELFFSNPNFAIQVWINYNQALLDFYKRFPDRCILFNTYSIVHDPAVIVEAIEKKFDISLSSIDKSIYDNSLIYSLESSSHRPVLIKDYFSEAFALYDELNTNAFGLDISSNLPWSEPTQLPSYKVWALQDWLDIRRLERQQATLKSELDNAQSQFQQTQVELERSHSQLQQTQTELERSQSQLQHTQSELERSQSQLQHTQTELERSQSQLQHTQSELERSQSQLQHTQTELERSQSQLQHTQSELERSQTVIREMESSKFWKLRTAWFRLSGKLRQPVLISCAEYRG